MGIAKGKALPGRSPVPVSGQNHNIFLLGMLGVITGPLHPQSPDGPRAARLAQQGRQRGATFRRDLIHDKGVVQAYRFILRRVVDDLAQRFHRIAGHNGGRDGACNIKGPGKPRRPIGMFGPNEGKLPRPCVRVGKIHRVKFKARAPADGRQCGPQRGRVTTQYGRDPNRAIRIPKNLIPILIAIVIPAKHKPAAGTHFDQMERKACLPSDDLKSRHQKSRTPNLIGVGDVGGNDLWKAVRMIANKISE
jgi:hypothetical protein